MAWDLSSLRDGISNIYSSKADLRSYWIDEEPSITAALTSISKKLGSERYNPKEVIDVGGSGIVIKLLDMKFPQLDKALKCPRPIAGKIQLVAELLNKEIQYLAELHHPRIIRILDYYCIEKDDEALNCKLAAHDDSIIRDDVGDGNIGHYTILPFYIMDFIDGDKSRKFIRASPKTVVPLIESISGILKYLHSFPSGAFAHLDIKPDNFVVTSDGRVIMIDLGTCKRLTGPGDSTVVACTLSYAAPGLIQILDPDPTDENRAKGKIPRASIQREWDLWAFANSILSWLGLDHRTGTIEYQNVLQGLDSYTRKFLFLLSARIMGADCPSWLTKKVGLSPDFLKQVPIVSAAELCEIVGRLSGSVNTLKQIPEFCTAQTNTIQAAPSQHILVTPAVRAVLENRLFRRLNSISQLGLVSQVYPSAKHSRKEHSLGTYANVCRMVKALYDDRASPLFCHLFNSIEIRALLVTALLHDIGQFPLAHDLEEIDKSIFDHGDLTSAALLGVWNKKKRGSKKIRFESLASILEKWDVTYDQVSKIMSAKPKNRAAAVKDKLLRSLLSGPIDADKLDYLLRDGRQLGLPYPKGVDVERIYSCITTVVVDLEGDHTDMGLPANAYLCLCSCPEGGYI